jgi:hypothetical protein
MPGDQAVPLKVDGVVPAEPGLGTSARAIFITSAFRYRNGCWDRSQQRPNGPPGVLKTAKLVGLGTGTVQRLKQAVAIS